MSVDRLISKCWMTSEMTSNDKVDIGASEAMIVRDQDCHWIDETLKIMTDHGVRDSQSQELRLGGWSSHLHV